MISNLYDSPAGTVVKSPFDFAEGKNRIAIRVQAFDFDENEDELPIDNIEFCRYFDSLGIENHIWNGFVFVIVDESQIEFLGAMPSRETYRVGYFQSPLFLAKTSMSNAQLEEANEVYREKDTCTFVVSLCWSLAPETDIKNQESKRGEAFSEDEKNELKSTIIDAYLCKMAEYSGIDPNKIEYFNRKMALLTLTKPEFEKLIGSESYFSQIEIF